MTHEYLSTSCFHEAEALAAGDPLRAAELHAYCQNMIGFQGIKRPSQCKFCEARCSCPGHQDQPA